MSHKHLDDYLSKLVQQAVAVDPATYKMIAQNPRKSPNHKRPRGFQNAVPRLYTASVLWGIEGSLFRIGDQPGFGRKQESPRQY